MNKPDEAASLPSRGEVRAEINRPVDAPGVRSAEHEGAAKARDAADAKKRTAPPEERRDDRRRRFLDVIGPPTTDAPPVDLAFIRLGVQSVGLGMDDWELNAALEDLEGEGWVEKCVQNNVLHYRRRVGPIGDSPSTTFGASGPSETRADIENWPRVKES